MKSLAKALKFGEYLSVNEGWLYNEFADDLDDFGFERELVKFLGEYEQEWARLQRDYNWNRESRQHKGQHFAINVKVYEYPRLEEINSVLGLDLDEEALNEYWWEFMEEIRGQFTEDIEQQYGWIDSVGWGGKSGGWLVIWPNRNEDDFEDEPNYQLSRYINDKLGLDEEAIQKMQREDSDPKFQKLVELGLAESSEMLGELKRDINNITEEMNEYLEKMREYRAGLEEISEMPKKFEENAVADFTDWLTDRLA
jgi:hypothetical protein